jgi:hypothetical protein
MYTGIDIFREIRDPKVLMGTFSRNCKRRRMPSESPDATDQRLVISVVRDSVAARRCPRLDCPRNVRCTCAEDRARLNPGICRGRVGVRPVRCPRRPYEAINGEERLLQTKVVPRVCTDEHRVRRLACGVRRSYVSLNSAERLADGSGVPHHASLQQHLSVRRKMVA